MNGKSNWMWDPRSSLTECYHIWTIKGSILNSAQNINTALSFIMMSPSDSPTPLTAGGQVNTHIIPLLVGVFQMTEKRKASTFHKKWLKLNSFWHKLPKTLSN